MCLRAQMRPPAHPRRADGCRALITFAGLIVLQLAFLETMRRRIGPESPTPADLLTGSRVVCAAGILTAAVTGPGVQTQKQQRRLFVLAVLAATITDWCDGPLARRFGPTRLGAVMDIEADSLLTLALAAAAVQWGGLSRLVLIPPVVRYSDLVVARLGGRPDALLSARVGARSTAVFPKPPAPCGHRRQSCATGDPGTRWAATLRITVGERAAAAQGRGRWGESLFAEGWVCRVALRPPAAGLPRWRASA